MSLEKIGKMVALIREGLEKVANYKISHSEHSVLMGKINDFLNLAQEELEGHDHFFGTIKRKVNNYLGIEKKELNSAIDYILKLVKMERERQKT